MGPTTESSAGLHPTPGLRVALELLRAGCPAVVIRQALEDDLGLSAIEAMQATAAAQRIARKRDA